MVDLVEQISTQSPTMAAIAIEDSRWQFVPRVEDRRKNIGADALQTVGLVPIEIDNRHGPTDRRLETSHLGSLASERYVVPPIV